MTTEEYAEIAYTITNAWPGQFDEDNVAAYAKLLMGYDFQATEAALIKLAKDGQRLVPSVGLIIQAIEAVSESPVPSWSEAYAQIRTMIGRRGRDWGEYRPDVEYAEGMDPMVVAFVLQEGLGHLAMLPVHEPEHGELRVRQLSERFAEFCDVQRERDRRRTALEAAGVRPEVEGGGRKELTA